MLGPVQLLVVGFDHEELPDELLARIRALEEHEAVRVIDVLAVHKDADGVVETLQISDLSDSEKQAFGETARALIGLGEVAGGDAAAAARLWSGEDLDLDEDSMVDVLAEIPTDATVAIALLEHRWAIPLREATLVAGGFPILDTWVHPRDLVEVGLLAAGEAERASG
jgi:uncharacterized membrane protein